MLQTVLSVFSLCQRFVCMKYFQTEQKIWAMMRMYKEWAVTGTFIQEEA